MTRRHNSVRFEGDILTLSPLVVVDGSLSPLVVVEGPVFGVGSLMLRTANRPPPSLFCFCNYLNRAGFNNIQEPETVVQHTFLSIPTTWEMHFNPDLEPKLTKCSKAYTMMASREILHMKSTQKPYKGPLQISKPQERPLARSANYESY